MEHFKRNICVPLPSNITNQITTCDNSEQYVINFLENLLPPSDTKAIADELRKSFIFNKHKTKRKQKEKYKGKRLTTKKRNELGLRKINGRNGTKYKDLLALNQLWLKYMQEMLGEKFFNNIPQDPTDPNWENVNQQLMKADFHGAEISIARSKCPSLVGLGGIVIQETKNAFRICGKDNIIRTIPKDVTVMDLRLGRLKLQLFGREVALRPTERTVKKFKAARAYEL